jgi:hypothetical protein
MSQLNPTAVPGRNRGRLTRRLRRLSVSLAVAACALVLGAGAASADSFSSKVPPQHWYGYFGNCSITAGPVYDPSTSSHGFAVIGGGQLTCTTVHTYQVWTQEYFSATGVGASYYPRGTTGYYTASNYGFSGIVESGRACGIGHWFTRVTVSVSGYSPIYFDSYANYVPALGYSATVC